MISPPICWPRDIAACACPPSHSATWRSRSGPQVYSAQYLQDPVAPKGNLIHLEHFRRFENPIERHAFEKVFQSWDPASSVSATADWSVCTTWGYLAGRYFLLDIYRRRVEYPDLKRAIIALQRKSRADQVLMEDSSIGIGLIQEFTNPARSS